MMETQPPPAVAVSKHWLKGLRNARLIEGGPGQTVGERKETTLIIKLTHVINIRNSALKHDIAPEVSE